VARQKKPEEHGHSESWLVSYCDMISLLVTFFLMMMTFSTSDQHDVREIGLGLLRGHGGVWKNKVSFPEMVEVDPESVERVGRGMAQLAKESGSSLSTRSLVDGFSVSFDLDSSFEPGSDAPTKALRANLERLANVLAVHDRLSIVEGFTDGQFKPSSKFPDERAMGLARAESAAKILLDTHKVAPESLRVSTQVSLRPRAENDTPLGRASNRRVEVRIVAMVPPKAPLPHTDGTEER
jgi:chemotaxis protein MotB